MIVKRQGIILGFPGAVEDAAPWAEVLPDVQNQIFECEAHRKIGSATRASASPLLAVAFGLAYLLHRRLEDMARAVAGSVLVRSLISSWGQTLLYPMLRTDI